MSDPIANTERRALFQQVKPKLASCLPKNFSSLLVCALWAGLAGSALSVGCAEPKPEHLHCDDLLPADDVSFQALVDLSLGDTDKGCTEGSCHNSEVQRGHLRLDTPELLFEEYTLHPELNYALLVIGRMPDHGTLWDENELRMFRSWYCYGAFAP